MAPTRIRLLLALAVIAGAVGWGASELTAGQSGRALPVPWLAAATSWLLAFALGTWTLTSRPRLLRKPRASLMPPLVAARTAALAMAASRTGALVAGFYAGIAVGTIPQRATPAGSDAIASAGAASLGAIALTAIALWLERLCRLRAQDDDDAGSANGVGRVTS